jgi:CheY-like chemotaxis protein
MTSQQSGQLQKGCVLIIDDDPGILETLAEVLSFYGYETLVAGNPFEGITLFEAHQNQIDVVFLDYSLEGMDGGQVYLRLKEFCPYVKAILSSGYGGDDAEINRLLKTGIGCFLRKPFSIEELIGQIERLMVK